MVRPNHPQAFQLQIKYYEQPTRTQIVLVKGTLAEAFQKGETIYRADNLGLIKHVRVHSSTGVFIGRVKVVSVGVNDDC